MCDWCWSQADIAVLENNVRAELASVLGIDPARLEIERVGRGSVIVDFCILPPPEESEDVGGGAAGGGGWGEQGRKSKVVLDAQALAELLRVQVCGANHAHAHTPIHTAGHTRAYLVNPHLLACNISIYVDDRWQTRRRSSASVASSPQRRIWTVFCRR